MIMMSAPKPSTRFDLDTGVSIAADTYGDPSNQLVLFLHCPISDPSHLLSRSRKVLVLSCSFLHIVIVGEVTEIEYGSFAVRPVGR